MLRLLHLLFYGIFPFVLLHGQTFKIDSLRNVVNKSSSATIKRGALVELIEQFQNLEGYDSISFYLRQNLPSILQESESGDVDSTNVLLLAYAGSNYQFYKLDSAIMLSTKALEWGRQIGFKKGEALASMYLGENYRLHGELTRALELFFNGLQKSREIGDLNIASSSHGFIGIAYSELGEYRLALNHLFHGLRGRDSISNISMIPFIIANIGDTYRKFNMLDSALHYTEIARKMTDSMGLIITPMGSEVLLGLGRIYTNMNEPKKAMQYYREAMNVGDYLNISISQYLMADLFYALHQKDSSLHYARLGFLNIKNSSQNTRLIDASLILAKIFKSDGMIDSALYYRELAYQLRDSIFSPQKFRKLQLASLKQLQQEQALLQKQKEAEQEREKFINRIKIYSLLALMAFFFLFAIILFRNNRQKQSANMLLQDQKNEVSRALTELKSTQVQLIQSEKMASLGELTAGIAHEIQNPLNFVNNFSEVNKDLLIDLKDEIKKGNLEEVAAIADDVISNEEKINHHGKRADAIVKGMLQHSKSSSGVKESTDINALADEYLRLAYHGLRAKDKAFNATVKTDFDPSLGKVDIIPQDIGRVLLNLINNAFYAVNERSKEAVNDYVPEVTVSTRLVTASGNPLIRQSANAIIISVKDNGNGISQKILDKIFQPFFTTKPTGQGTGLGLSLSYDIVKAHSGDLRVETKEGEGSKFILALPVN
jgi:signal transduction histidine kinase